MEVRGKAAIKGSNEEEGVVSRTVACGGKHYDRYISCSSLKPSTKGEACNIVFSQHLLPETEVETTWSKNAGFAVDVKMDEYPFLSVT